MLFLPLYVVSVFTILSQNPSPTRPSGSVFPGGFFIIIFGIFLGVIVYVVWRSLKQSALTALRAKSFAEANKLRLLGHADTQDPTLHPGLIFQLGSDRQFVPAFEFPNNANTIVGNYQYTTGSGKNRRVHQHGFVRIRLSRKLPHVLLDATSNNFMRRVSNLSTFKDEQKIELEGDFNQYFNTYAPVNYGRDTLYWLTPELMELLKIHMSSYDIEVVDNYVYVYSQGSFSMNEQTMPKLLDLAAWLHHEFEENTDRYSDERVGSFTANVIAEPGKRLKKGVPWLAIIATIVYIIIEFMAELWTD